VKGLGVRMYDHRKEHPEAYRPAWMRYVGSSLISDCYYVYNPFGSFLQIVRFEDNWVPWLRGWKCTCHEKRCEHVAFVRERLGE